VKIVIFGAGPIGLVTSLSLCHYGHEVLCIDTNSELIQKLSIGCCELYEKGLQQQLELALKNKQIQFTTDLKTACEFSDIFFIAVGTPSQHNGSCDLSQMDSCLKSIHSLHTESVKKIVIKSTVPPSTHQKFAEKYKDSIFISHPEFLREGSAFQDAIHPDRIVIGCTTPEAEQLIYKIYGNLIQKTKLILTDPASAEIAKYAANSFLAARVSLMNEFQN
jgi:UDPglucose 6-dehydrogenase